MSTNYENFFPEVLPFFPALPEIIIVNAIRNACIEFCDRTDYLFYTPISYDLIANEDEYDLTLDVPTDTTVARVQSAWCNGYQLFPKSEDELQKIYFLDWRSQVGRPAYFTQYKPDTLVVVPTPVVTVSGGLSTTLILRPTRTSTTVDDSIFERWLDVIAAGAKSRLYTIPGVPSTDGGAAAAYAAQFSAGCDKAIAERNRGLTRRALRVRPPKLV